MNAITPFRIVKVLPVIGMTPHEIAETEKEILRSRLNLALLNDEIEERHKELLSLKATRLALSDKIHQLQNKLRR